MKAFQRMPTAFSKERVEQMLAAGFSRASAGRLLRLAHFHSHVKWNNQRENRVFSPSILRRPLSRAQLLLSRSNACQRLFSP
jgi:hypothetical protein